MVVVRVLSSFFIFDSTYRTDVQRDWHEAMPFLHRYTARKSIYLCVGVNDVQVYIV